MAKDNSSCAHIEQGLRFNPACFWARMPRGFETQLFTKRPDIKSLDLLPKIKVGIFQPKRLTGAVIIMNSLITSGILKTLYALSSGLAVVCLFVMGCAREQIKTAPEQMVPQYVPRELPAEEIPRYSVYTIFPAVHLRTGPDVTSRVVTQLRHNETLGVFGEKAEWLYVKTRVGTAGYVRKDMVSDLVIKVHKQERRLYLSKQGQTIKTYRIALSAENPLRDKVQRGDYGTPEGRYYICQMNGNPAQLKYGPRSLLISYPSSDDARRGFKEGLIDYATYREIILAIKDGRTPNQKTPLGGQIRIHGCGGKYDWTKGCIALEDHDIIEIYDTVSTGVRVEIYKSAAQDKELNTPTFLSAKVLEGAQQQFFRGKLYAYQEEGKSLGDYSSRITQNHADLELLNAIARHANIDLEALIQEDAMRYPGRYAACGAGEAQRPALNFCQVKTWFYYHSQVLSSILGMQFITYLKPGDFIIMNASGSSEAQGEVLGIIDAATERNGFPKIITIWQKPGLVVANPQKPPGILYCFRLTHPFEYQ